MKYDPEKHHRKSIRLRGYDYASAGVYFITVCTHQRQCLFGDVVNGTIQLSKYGTIAATEWVRSADIRQEIELGEWVVMPNHIHGIVFLHNPPIVGAQGFAPSSLVSSSFTPSSFTPSSLVSSSFTPPNSTQGITVRKPKSLSTLIAGFKMAVTTQINCDRNTPRNPVWQRNYYEHIIQDETTFEKICAYIFNNPLSWDTDQLHPHNPSKW